MKNKNIVIKSIFSLFIILIGAIGCLKKDNTVKENDVSNKKNLNQVLNDTMFKTNDSTIFIEKDFLSFLNRFKCDSTFQYERINFPLKGTMMEKEKYKWEKIDWIYYYYYDVCLNINNIYSESIQTINEDNKVWRLFIENSGYDTFLEFKYIDDKWMLVKYNYYNY